MSTLEKRGTDTKVKRLPGGSQREGPKIRSSSVANESVVGLIFVRGPGTIHFCKRSRHNPEEAFSVPQPDQGHDGLLGVTGGPRIR